MAECSIVICRQVRNYQVIKYRAEYFLVGAIILLMDSLAENLYQLLYSFLLSG